ncbi:MAG: hypothetical protein MK236_09050 [Pedosphaera sp.]|nr:hypothetical protein [Pedosphaera sp.]
MGYLDYWRWYFWLVDKSTEEKERRQMKNSITVLFVLLVVGCGKTETERLEDSVVGSYEGETIKLVFLGNGVVKFYKNGEDEERFNWKIVGDEVHFITSYNPRMVIVYEINLNGDLTSIASIQDEREGIFSKELQRTYKRLK